jgi:hypothetical protein
MGTIGTIKNIFEHLMDISEQLTIYLEYLMHIV